MLISLRKKESSFVIHNQSTVLDPPVDESFAQSNISKRFTRKKNTSHEQHIALKAGKKEQINLDGKHSPRQSQSGIKITSNYIKTNDLFLRIGSTPTKQKKYYGPMSSDRATQSTNLKSRIQTQSSTFNQCMKQLRQQLQLKSNELMILEDEVMRLKRQIISKDEEGLKMNIKKQKQFNCQIAKYKDQIKLLTCEIADRNNEIKQYKKLQITLNRQIKSLKYDKVVLQKHIEQIYKKKLPKDLKELISFRQISLAKQMQQLKLKLEESKGQKQLQMESEIRRLKEDNNIHAASAKNFQIHSRILNRKITECEMELKEKSESFARYYLSMKESQNQLLDQLKKSRKENMKLRRLHILSNSHTKKKIYYMHSSSEESLSLSLSSNN